MPTLNAPAPSPPWAQVLQSQSARSAAEHDTEVRAQLEQIQQTLQSLPNHVRQMHADDLEQTTRQRLQTLESTVQLQQKELQEDREMKEVLRKELAEAEARFQDLQQRYGQETEGHERTRRELIRAQHSYDSAVLTNERLEMEHKTRYDQSENCVHQMTQRHEQVKQKFEQAQQRFEQAHQRCTELERSEQDLQEKVRMLSGVKASLEAQAGERERDLAGRLASTAEAARRLEGEKRVLEAEVDKVKHQHRECEQETRELRCRNAVLEDQLRDAQEQRKRFEQDQARAEQDIRQWYQKFIDSNKENTTLSKVNQDHKRDIWDLENQLRQERSIAAFPKPGELLKMMKAHEGESLANETFGLKKALARTKCDLDLCIRKLQEQEGIIKELREAASRRPVPVPGA